MQERINMIRTATEADISELMSIYSAAILNTTAMFDAESKHTGGTAGIKFGKKLSLHAYQIIYDRG